MNAPTPTQRPVHPVKFKLGDEVVEVERGGAVRVPPETWRSVWNDEPEDAELIIVSKVVPGGLKVYSWRSTSR